MGKEGIPAASGETSAGTARVISKAEYLKQVTGEFPGGPAVRTQHFHCWVPGTPSLVGEVGSCMLIGAAQNQPTNQKASYGASLCKVAPVGVTE